MDYVRPEPTAVKTIGVLQLVFGILGLVCGLIALAGGAKALNQGGGGGGMPGGLTEERIQQMVEDEIPHQKALEHVEMAVGVVLSILMVVSGGGLVNRQPWGRTVAIVYAISSICFHVVDLLYGILVVVPGMNAVADKVAAQAGANGGVIGGAMKGAMFVGLLISAAVTIYPIVVLVVMQRPGVKAALAGAGGEPFDVPRDYDDRERGPYGDVPPDDRYRQPPDDRLTP
jgi:hypothetical protein